MNVLLSLNGETLITETNEEESRLLHSILEFMTRHKEINSNFSDNVTDEEIEFAKKLSDDLSYYLDYEM